MGVVGLENKLQQIHNQGDLDWRRWQAVSDILHMTFLAKSGHIGGPIGFSSAMLMFIDRADLNPNDPYDVSRDKLVFGAGHYSAAAYSVLANLYLRGKHDEIVANFRGIKDVVEGHVTHHFPFIWDSTGHLGNTLGIALGHNLADRLLGHNDTMVYAFDGDGAQTKGGLDEAQRAISKYEFMFGLRIAHVIDINSMQLSDKTKNIMPMNIKARAVANMMPVVDRVDVGGQTPAIDGYWFEVLDAAIAKAKNLNVSTVLVKTTMGKGVPEAEAGGWKYHGKPVADLDAALKAIDRPNRLEEYRNIRADSSRLTGFAGRPQFVPQINTGQRIVYTTPTACRKATEAAMLSMAETTMDIAGKPKQKDYSPMAFVDCDLAGSVGLEKLKKFTRNFLQIGIQENTAAVVAGTMSARGISTWLAMFGAFGHSMTYNDHFLTAMNDGNLKLVTTHNSIDVGEDSKTHSPINYLVLSGHPGWQTFCPADANQADAQIRYMGANFGNMHLATGRSDLMVMTRQGSDRPFYDENYSFDPGKFDVLRNYGNDVVIVTYGTPTGRAVKAAEMLKGEVGVTVINLPTPAMIPEAEKLAGILSDAKLVVTFEDHYIETGIRDRVNALLQSYHQKTRTAPRYDTVNIGMKEYSKSATSEVLYKHFGIHEDDLVKIARERIKK
ncbi:MAG: transketolase C-terminal domain-containing protein [archaeon]